MGEFIGGRRGGGSDGKGLEGSREEKKDLLKCKIEKIGHKKLLESGGAVNGQRRAGGGAEKMKEPRS